MKRLLVFVCSGLLIMAFIYGCGKKEEPAPTPEPAVKEMPETTAVDTLMMEDTIKAKDTTKMETAKPKPGGK
jgi:hypothetical protein